MQLLMETLNLISGYNSTIEKQELKAIEKVEQEVIKEQKNKKELIFSIEY